MKLNIKSIIRKSSTVKEAIEKRDTAKTLALGCLAAAILCAVLGAIIQLAFLESLGAFAIVVAVIFFVLWLSARNEATRLLNIFCECGEKYLFPQHTTYEITGEQLSSGKNSNGKGVASHISTKVAFCCKCAKCGKIHTFNTSFVTERKVYNERGVLMTTKSFPLEKQLADFFKV